MPSWLVINTGLSKHILIAFLEEFLKDLIKKICVFVFLCEGMYLWVQVPVEAIGVRSPEPEAHVAHNVGAGNWEVHVLNSWAISPAP